MSSKSSIIHSDRGTHVYEETNEWDEIHKQWALYWAGEWEDFKNVQVTGAFLVIVFRNGHVLNIPLEDLSEIEFDSYGYGFKVNCGSKTYTDVLLLKDKESFLFK